MSGRSQHDRDSAELRKLCAERDTLTAELQRTSDYLHHEEARCRLMLVEVEELRAKMLRIASCDPARHSIEWARDQASLCDNSAWLQWKGASDRCEALAAELATAKSRNADLTQHKTDYMEASEQPRKALEAELATLKAGDGEQKPYAYSYGRNNGDGTWSPVIDQGSMVKTGENKYEYGPPLNACLDCPVIPLFTTPQPVQDVSGLVSALELAANRLGRTAIYVDFEMRSEIDEWEQEAREALAKFAQGGGNV